MLQLPGYDASRVAALHASHIRLLLCQPLALLLLPALCTQAYAASNAAPDKPGSTVPPGEYRATRQPPQMQLRPDTVLSSVGPVVFAQPGLLHRQGTAKEHRAKAACCSCCRGVDTQV